MGLVVGCGVGCNGFLLLCLLWVVDVCEWQVWLPVEDVDHVVEDGLLFLLNKYYYHYWF